jgi:hypothetical protein
MDKIWNSGMLHLLRVACHQGWKKSKEVHDGKNNYAKGGEKHFKTKMFLKHQDMNCRNISFSNDHTYGSESWTTRKKNLKNLTFLSYGLAENSKCCGQKGNQTKTFFRKLDKTF